jgi:hypothetical protein
LGIGVLLRGTSAEAQSNYRLLPVGGRSQLLGGTGMVYGRDAAAAYLNPATAVLVDDDRLSFSINVYTASYVYAPRWYVPGPIDRSKFGDITPEDTNMWNLEFNALPSSLCIFFNAGDVPGSVGRAAGRGRDSRLGFCLATTYGQSLDYAAQQLEHPVKGAVSRQAQTLHQSYSRFAAGPTYALRISDSIAFGASVHGTLANHRNLIASSATTYGSGPAPINSTFYSGSRGDSFQFEALAGVTWRRGIVTTGLSVKAPSIHVYGVGGANQQVAFDGAGSHSSVTAINGSFVSRSPLRVGLGTGIEGDWGQAEFNAFYSSALGQAYSVEFDGRDIETTNGVVDDRDFNYSFGERAKGVVNFAVGAEYFMSEKISFLGGLATDITAVPSGALKGSLVNYYPSQTSRLSASFGVGSHGEGGELLIGGEASVGWGKRLSVNNYELPPDLTTINHGTYQLMLVVAGSTSFRAIKRAVHDVTNVIKDPKPPVHSPGPKTEEN